MQIRAVNCDLLIFIWTNYWIKLKSEDISAENYMKKANLSFW